MKKDMVFYNLLDSMEKDCCPICALVQKRTLQLMDGFLYESVNDFSIRKAISASHGFCGKHSAMLMHMGDPLAHALIYEGLIQSAADAVRQGRLTECMDHTGCLFCKQAREAEQSYCLLFLAAFREDEFKQKYIRDGMLCLAHLQKISVLAASTMDKNFYRQIEKETLSKYRQLAAFLQEIQRKNDYRFAGEAWTDGAKDSWKRAVAVINGYSDV